MSQLRYKEFSGLNLPAIGQEMLAKWTEEKAFEKSVSLREGATPFVFYEGPPSANGMPGIHHVISRTLKDLVCRYKTMKGFQVHRKGGWDTHGLPIELGVEKELGITKEDIGKKISVEDYNKKCREAVLRYKDKWDDITRQMGYWVDLKHPYVTFENDYIESLWWLLKKMYDRGLLYESVSIQPYSPAAGTGLSSHELNQPGTYKDVKDTSATVMFRALQDEKSKFLHDAVHGAEIFFLAWTTTPWTLPSNLGLTVGPNIDYVLVQTFNPYTHLSVNVVLAKKLLHKYLKAEGEQGDFEGYSKETKLIPWKVLLEFKGADIEGCRYEQLLPYEANSPAVIETITPGARPFVVMTDSFVTTEDGTGIVHTAPAFGADDYKVGKKNSIGILTMVDREGKFVDGMGEFSGRYVKDYKNQKDYVDVNVDIAVKLKLENRAFKVEKYEHSYPHCWRTDKPILYYPLDAWFIKTSALKDRMVELNKTIYWKPASTGTGRFGNWLENMVDWNLSRSRFWGTPLPIWRTEDGEEEVCIGSVKQLKEQILISNNFYTSQERITLFDSEREIFLGIRAFEYQLTNRKDVEFAMCRPDLPNGFVHFLWGVEGDPEKDFGGGYGTAKIIAKRRWEQENLPEFKSLSTADVFKGIATAISTGKIVRIYGPEQARRVDIQSDDYVVIVSEFLHEESYNWLITGFKKKRETDAAGSDSALSDATHITPTLNRGDVGAVSESKVSYYSLNPVFKFETEDLHKPYVDDIFFISAGGKIMRRVPDLIDVWFDSGAMPYAQHHFPFENKELFSKNYPADFIAEGVDQTRGWFYTLHAIASLIKEDVIAELEAAGLPTGKVDGRAYKAVVSNGLVLDKDGNKMSKRLGNVVDPFKTIAEFGADATRWYLITNASPWDNLKFDVNGIKEIQRKFFGTFYNTYQFFALYANVDGFSFKEEYIDLSERPEIDQWIISSLNTLIKEVNAAFNDYEPTQAGRLVETFVDEHLSNWYVRLSRRRFWKGEYEFDKICAFQTLYECLETLTKLIAPISPFFSDTIFRALNEVTGRNAISSVHHSGFPEANEAFIDPLLEERMQLAQDTSSLVLSLRKKVNIKVRQPLQKVLIPVLNPQMKAQLEKVADLVLAEVNVKEIEYLTETEGFIKKKIKPNFIALGKKLGSKMKAVSVAISGFGQHQISELERNGETTITIDGEPLTLKLEEVDISAEDIPGWSVATKGPLTIALDITITPPLKQEGEARELVNRIQNLRKDNGFDLTDRINVRWFGPENIRDSFNVFKSYICAEILADSLEFDTAVYDGTEIEVNDAKIKIHITKNGV
jgi:isoleucyl-tRNA synthetase